MAKVKTDKVKSDSKPEKKRLLDFFIEGEQKGYQEILNVMLEGDNDLDLKTHITKPKQLSALYTLQEYIDVKLPSTALLIQIFTDKYLRYMVSFKRMSRMEIIKALSIATAQDELENVTTAKRMTTNMKKV